MNEQNTPDESKDNATAQDEDPAVKYMKKLFEFSEKLRREQEEKAQRNND